MSEGLPVPEQNKAEKFVKLLRTNAEEGAVAREQPGPEYFYRARDAGKELAVYGFSHTYSTEKYKDVAQALDSFKPQLVLVEGGDWSSRFEGRSGEEIIKDAGEQAYISFLAKERGIEVKTWDIPGSQMYEAISGENSQDALLGWVIGSNIRYLYDSDKPRTMENFYAHLGEKSRAFAEKNGIDISSENIERVAKKYTGQTIEEMDRSLAYNLCNPFADTEGSKVARDMSERRDAHAVEVFVEAKEKYDRIFATCGRNHAIRWEPAISALYGESERI